MTTPLEPLPDFHPDTETALLRFRAKRSMSLRRRQFAVGTCLALAALLAFGPTRAYTQRCIVACVAIVNPVSSQPMVDQNGTPLRFADYSGRVLLVNYFATWCEPCRQEAQWLNELQDSYASKGLSVLAVSVDDDGWNSVKPFLQQNSVKYPVVLQDPSLKQRFGEVTYIPTSIFVDRAGKGDVVRTGRMSKEVLETQIRNLLAASNKK